MARACTAARLSPDPVEESARELRPDAHRTRIAEELGYDTIRCNLSESSVTDRRLGDLNLQLDDILLCYGDHRGAPDLRRLIAGLGPGACRR